MTPITCAICQTTPATDDCGDVRVCAICLRLVQDEADRRLLLMVATLETMARQEATA